MHFLEHAMSQRHPLLPTLAIFAASIAAALFLISNA
jgi:hypothetical protein